MLLLLLALLAFVVELVFQSLAFTFSPGSQTSKEKDLLANAARLHKDAEVWNSPATFSKWAKMSRKATAMEKKAIEMETNRKAKAKR